MQNRAARVLTFSNYDCSTSELFENLKWSKLVHQRAVNKAIMMHSIVNNTAPEYLTSRFVRRCDLTSYNLRKNEYKLAVLQPRTEFYKRSLSYSESVLWNSSPLEVRQLTSSSIFKRKLGDINFDGQIIQLAIFCFYTRSPWKVFSFYLHYFRFYVRF